MSFEKIMWSKRNNPQPKAMANMLSTGFTLPNTEEDRRPSPQRLKKEQFWELPEHALQMDTHPLTVCISNIVCGEGTHYVSLLLTGESRCMLGTVS